MRHHHDKSCAIRLPTATRRTVCTCGRENCELLSMYETEADRRVRYELELIRRYQNMRRWAIGATILNGIAITAVAAAVLLS